MESPKAVQILAEIENLPTRWGNQLNGNIDQLCWQPLRLESPHSLGKPIEWKLLKDMMYPASVKASPLAGETN